MPRIVLLDANMFLRITERGLATADPRIAGMVTNLLNEG